MNILVTGGCGYIGSALVRTLKSTQKHVYHVLVVDDMRSPAKDSGPAWAFEIEDTDMLTKAMSTFHPSVVVHLAADPSVMSSIRTPDDTYQTNVLGTESVLRAAAATQVPRVVLASSGGAVYGHRPLGHRCKEEEECKPVSPYGLSKLMNEHQLRMYSEEFQQFEGIALRFGNVYGPRMSMGVHKAWCESIQKGDPITLFGSGLSTRDYVHIDSVVQAIVLSLSQPVFERFSVFNVGSGESTSLARLARAAEESERDARRTYELHRKGEVVFNCLDIRKIHEQWGWYPAERPLWTGDHATNA